MLCLSTLFTLSFCEWFPVNVALTKHCQKQLILRKFRPFLKPNCLRQYALFCSIPVR